MKDPVHGPPFPVSTPLAGAWADCDMHIGAEVRIDVSSDDGSKFDQNVTGFRAREEFGFNATPNVATGNVREDSRRSGVDRRDMG